MSDQQQVMLPAEGRLSLSHIGSCCISAPEWYRVQLLVIGRAAMADGVLAEYSSTAPVSTAATCLTQHT